MSTGSDRQTNKTGLLEAIYDVDYKSWNLYTKRHWVFQQEKYCVRSQHHSHYIPWGRKLSVRGKKVYQRHSHPHLLDKFKMLEGWYISFPASTCGQIWLLIHRNGHMQCLLCHHNTNFRVCYQSREEGKFS